ncbi:hypothetical protein ACRAKI_36225 [Saccharothrix isguenensis]
MVWAARPPARPPSGDRALPLVSDDGPAAEGFTRFIALAAR